MSSCSICPRRYGPSSATPLLKSWMPRPTSPAILAGLHLGVRGSEKIALSRGNGRRKIAAVHIVDHLRRALHRNNRSDSEKNRSRGQVTKAPRRKIDAQSVEIPNNRGIMMTIMPIFQVRTRNTNAQGRTCSKAPSPGAHASARGEETSLKSRLCVNRGAAVGQVSIEAPIHRISAQGRILNLGQPVTVVTGITRHDLKAS